MIQDGKQFGDEYLAELDLIEVVETTKDDYESDVVEPESPVAKSSTVDQEPSSDSEYRENDIQEDSDRSYCIYIIQCLRKCSLCSNVNLWLSAAKQSIFTAHIWIPM